MAGAGALGGPSLHSMNSRSSAKGPMGSGSPASERKSSGGNVAGAGGAGQGDDEQDEEEEEDEATEDRLGGGRSDLDMHGGE